MPTIRHTDFVTYFPSRLLSPQPHGNPAVSKDRNSRNQRRPARSAGW